MDYTDTLFHYATALVICASVNWLFVGRSISGRQLSSRMGSAWVAARWLGLGAFAACVMIGPGNSEHGPLVALIGAGILTIGTCQRFGSS